MAKKRGLSWEDVFKGPGADDPARETLKQKIAAAAAGFVLHGDAGRRKSEAAELKELLGSLEQLLKAHANSDTREVAEVRSLLEFAVLKVKSGFARLS